MASRTSTFTLLAALSLITAGCGDDKAPSQTETETGDGDGDPGDGDGDGTPGDGDGTPGDGDGAPGDGDGAPGDGDGDGEPGTCDPEGNAYATFSIDVFDPNVDEDWEMLCTSGGVQPADGGESGYQILLHDCVSMLNVEPAPPEVVLFIDSSPATEPLVQPDIGVRLRWVQHPPFIPGKWFTLHTDPGDTLLLAGVDGPSVLPMSPLAFDYAPLGVELVPIGCEGVEHSSGCGLAERQAFELSWDGDTATISDKNFGFVGQLVSYEGVVDSALVFPQLLCDDFPDKILRALFFLIPEG